MISILDLAFSLLNFAIVLAVGVYVFKSYVGPQLREKIVQEYTDFMNVHNEHRSLMLEQQTLEEEILDQEDQAALLFKKINQWRNMVEISTQAELLAQEKTKKSLAEYYVQQSRQYALHKAYRDIGPLVVHKLEQDLKKRFSDPQEGHAYIARILRKVAYEK